MNGNPSNVASFTADCKTITYSYFTIVCLIAKMTVENRKWW